MPAYVEQMFDRLEASGIIVGWNRDDWEIWTTTIGLDIRIAPRAETKPSESAELAAIESEAAGPRRSRSLERLDPLGGGLGLRAFRDSP